MRKYPPEIQTEVPALNESTAAPAWIISLEVSMATAWRGVRPSLSGAVSMATSIEERASDLCMAG